MYLVADSREKKGKATKSGLSAEKLDSISYRYIAFGFPFFTPGSLIFGMIWAYYAWGRYLGYDPKEVWTLITWFVFPLYLHMRIVFGWKGHRSAYIAILGFLSALFTYFGVNIELKMYTLSRKLAKLYAISLSCYCISNFIPGLWS